MQKLRLPITSDAGLLAYRELDDALRLTDAAANTEILSLIARLRAPPVSA